MASLELATHLYEALGLCCMLYTLIGAITIVYRVRYSDLPLLQNVSTGKQIQPIA
jgi:hypothetical protein